MWPVTGREGIDDTMSSYRAGCLVTIRAWVAFATDRQQVDSEIVGLPVMTAIHSQHVNYRRCQDLWCIRSVPCTGRRQIVGLVVLEEMASRVPSSRVAVARRAEKRSR